MKFHAGIAGQLGVISFLLFASTWLGTSLSAADRKERIVPDPMTAYKEQTIGGFTVLVNRELKEHPEEFAAAVKEFEKQSEQIGKVLSADRYERLKQVRIWLEWERKPSGAAEYHVNRGWLKSNGYLTEKVHNIELSNARNFVRWSNMNQPWMLLHELAHAYHYQILGVEDADVKAAFDQAVERKIYESVERAGGKKEEKHYALTNEKEYFAELTESYFGKNDFFPFNRDELEKFDPVGFALMKKVWEEAELTKENKASPND